MALFTWKEGQPRTGPALGDKRTVTRPVLLRKLNGEWRALGVERIDQEYLREWFGGEPRESWHDIAWSPEVRGAGYARSSAPANDDA